MTHISLSQDGFQHEDFWETGKTYLSSLLLLSPLEFSWLVFSGSTFDHFCHWFSDITIPYGYDHPTVVVVQSLSHVRFFATPWTVACQASLSITNSWSLPKLMSIAMTGPTSYQGSKELIGQGHTLHRWVKWDFLFVFP